MTDLDNAEAIINIIRAREHAKIMKEIRAFAGDYAHQIEGVDVVSVKDLLTFLEGPQKE